MGEQEAITLHTKQLGKNIKTPSQHAVRGMKKERKGKREKGKRGGGEKHKKTPPLHTVRGMKKGRKGKREKVRRGKT